MQELLETKTILCPFSQVGEEDVSCDRGACNAFDHKANDCLYIRVGRAFSDLMQDNRSQDSLLSHGYNFMAIYQQHYKRIYSTAYQMLKNKEDAEDICQETFIRAYKNISAIDPEVPVYSWLCRVATNLCIDRVRKEKGRQAIDIDTLINPNSVHRSVAHIIEAMDVDHNIELKENVTLVGKIMDKMSPRYCQILMLRVCEELSSKEVAEILNITPTAVDTLFYRAKKKFKTLYRHIVLFTVCNIILNYLVGILSDTIIQPT